ncbi:MAG: hypothetical protein H0X33_11855 [Taibaiella sp.]|nr:hypothetical protein [Taibaiella sp.]
MRNALIALTIAGLIYGSAEAKNTHSKNNQNYPICRNESGYYQVCGKNSGQVWNSKKQHWDRTDAGSVSAGKDWDGSVKGWQTPQQTMLTATNTTTTTLVPDNMSGALAPAVMTNTHVAPSSPNNTDAMAANDFSDASAMSMNNVNAYSGYYTRHHIRFSNDDMDNPYEGKPSRQNDGVKKNEYRNLNTNQTNMKLPANDGTRP